jgi:phage shock protein C
MRFSSTWHASCFDPCIDGTWFRNAKGRTMQNAEHAAHEVDEFDRNEPDSLFGICQAAGEDLHVSPFFLRVGLIALLFFGPWLALGAYVGLGLLVGASRLLFPKPRAARALVEAADAKQPDATLEDERVPELIAA